MFSKDLDAIDQKILELLSENARMSYVDIGEEVKLSRVAVKTRIQALENQGIIEKYVTIINPTKLAHTTSVFFDIEVAPASIGEVTDILKKNDAFTQVYQMSGSSHLHVHALIGSDEELAELLNEVVNKLPGLKNVSCDTILVRVKDIKGMRL
ncbi:Lrp/AsnC family transcriptional regulator [Ruminococcaceae bacterium OttesenSCG-928-A11]|nr:Lrp/AsnC family transcriptional regulator [Ruminococcaceae bacterium OttesenSCG-928-A11]